MINYRELNIILTNDWPRELIKELCTMQYNYRYLHYSGGYMAHDSGDCNCGGGFTGG